MIEHYLRLEDARVVNTPDFALALENMRYVVRRRAISLFYGEPGLGKSLAAAAVVESMADGDGLVIKLTTEPNPKVLANRILEEITGVEHDYTRWEGARQIKRELRQRPRLIVVDEAQNLDTTSIEWLRWLHEEVPRCLTLLLVGGPQLRACLRRSPQLVRRIFQPSAFRALPSESVIATIRSFHPIYQDAGEALIADIDRRHCHGNFGHWAQLSITAYEMCRDTDQPTITPAIAEIAMRRNQDLHELQAP